MAVFAVVAFVAIFVFTLYLYVKNEKHKAVWDIPSPPARPLVGNLFYFLSDIDVIFDKLRAVALDYYPIYRLSVLSIHAVALLDPRDVEQVLSSTTHLGKTNIYTFLRPWLGTGLLTSTGAKWHKRRKILTPAFHFEILQQFVNVFNDETDKLVRMLEDNVDNVIDVVPAITNFTLQSIGETAMGLQNSDIDEQLEYKKAVYEIGKILLKRTSRFFYHIQAIYNISKLAQEQKRVVNILHSFTSKIVKEREVNLLVPDDKKKRLALLDLLLASKIKGEDIDNDGIREEVDTFMFEGHDTTAMAISFILLTLANEPQVQDRIYAEIVETIGTDKRPTTQDLQALKYTDRCVKECLRLFPSVPYIGRRISEDFWTTTGYFIPRGTRAQIHIFDIHRNPNLYPDPLKFDPDRFLPENISRRHPFAYIPFSAGPRNCIGQKFAMFEIKTVLCGILRRFVLEAEDNMFDIKFQPDLVLRAKNGVKVKFLQRL